MQEPPDWTYKHKRVATSIDAISRCEVSDPINLLFINVSLSDVCNVLQSANWKPTRIAGDLYLDSTCSRPQDFQLTFPQSVWRRFHIRLWQDGKNVIGSAHFETLRGFYRHEVHHFEGAEDKVADIFGDSGWKVNVRSRKLQDPEFERYNDGFCTEITR
jgi:hypothetical protein